jgi:hypothetical protein
MKEKLFYERYLRCALAFLRKEYPSELQREADEVFMRHVEALNEINVAGAYDFRQQIIVEAFANSIGPSSRLFSCQAPSWEVSCLKDTMQKLVELDEKR